jgi:hypothetical protein
MEKGRIEFNDPNFQPSDGPLSKRDPELTKRARDYAALKIGGDTFNNEGLALNLIDFSLAEHARLEAQLALAVKGLEKVRDETVTFCGASSADHAGGFCECGELKKFATDTLKQIKEME